MDLESSCLLDKIASSLTEIGRDFAPRTVNWNYAVMVVPYAGIRRKPTVHEIDLNACVNSLSVGLFWEFNAQRWRHTEYRYCPSFPTARDFILEEARHNEKITNIISKCISRSKALELRMPYNYSKIDDAVDTLLAQM